PTTTINYTVPKNSFVIIRVYDILGNEVTTLVNGEKSVGNYNVQFNGSNLASGIYFYSMHAGNYVETKKLILMK
ncbi:MAG TPA: T9SS type A sorting domain-containing protein, partial [Ignavibacteria bacterium]|nr:T9SS type A sorting domain-containing protein [Ignavibacteria bacterium]